MDNLKPIEKPFCLLGLLALGVLLCMALSGCGGGSTGQGALPATGSQASSSTGAGSGGHLVGVWEVDVDVQNEKMTFTPVDPAEAGIAGTRSRFQIEDANVSLTGTATWVSPTLSGNVTMTNNSANPLQFPMVMVTQISDGSVTVANEDFFNGPNPTWKYDSLAAGGTFPVQWQFNDPGGVDFKFYVHVFAWASQISGTGNNLNSVQFADANTGIAVGDGATIIRTTDGGAIWRPAVSVPGANDLYAVDMGDANTAWAVGWADAIWKTTDGGDNWVAQALPLAGVSYVAVCSINTNHVVATGGGSTILYTGDGGTNWFQASSVPSATDMYGVSMFDTLTGWTVGFGGAVWTTADGGDTWTAQVSNTTDNLRSVSFVDASNGTAVGAGDIIHTTDGGANWTVIWTPPANQVLYAVRQLTANEAWAVGVDGVTLNTLIYHIDYTNNSVIGPTSGTGALYGLAFGGDPTNGDGWAVGAGGLLLH